MSVAKPVVGIIMGSRSDWPTLKAAASILDKLKVPYETRVVSAHRTPEAALRPTPTAAQKRGLKVIIAGAGGAAHLPGMTASMTELPVLGVPIESRTLKGLDSLLSIVQMPAGVPVGTLAIGEAGATNAGLLAAQILALARQEACRTHRCLPRGADGRNRRGGRGQCLRRRFLPARPSASSAAASSAACSPSRQAALASSRTSIPTSPAPGLRGCRFEHGRKLYGRGGSRRVSPPRSMS